jgi:hypothetical protein
VRFAALVKSDYRVHTPGERYCDRCRPPLQVIYVAFEKKVSWHLVISDSNSHRRLCTLMFADDDKIVELVKRSGGTLTNLESKQALERGIENGKGGVFLKVTPDQYNKLVKR